MNNWAILQALVFEPRKAFAELDARPRFWWPMLVFTLATAALTFWYMSVVDMEWLIDQQLRNSALATNMTDAEIARLARQSASQSGLRVVLGTGGTLIALPVGLLIGALYYLLAGNITGVERSFRHWLSLSSWATLPAALAVIPAAMVLLTASSNQIGQEALQPFSLNELLFRRERGAPGYALFSSINVFQLFSLYLAAVGLKSWSGRGWLHAVVISALPFVVIYGVWAYFALR